MAADEQPRFVPAAMAQALRREQMRHDRGLGAAINAPDSYFSRLPSDLRQFIFAQCRRLHRCGLCSRECGERDWHTTRFGYSLLCRPCMQGLAEAVSRNYMDVVRVAARHPNVGLIVSYINDRRRKYNHRTKVSKLRLVQLDDVYRYRAIL